MNRTLLALFSIVAVIVLISLPMLRPGSQPATSPTPAQASSPSTPSLVVRDVKVYDQDGKLVYRGDVDLRPVLERIEQGIQDPHRNDGAVHRNLERKLPPKPDREYYREYVVRTPGLKAVGPQRVIIGKGGEVYYTPDHYNTFIRVR